MKLTLFAVLAALIIAIGWGLSSAGKPAPPRAHDMTLAVSPAWYDALPADPHAATQAYLARVPPAMRERGEAVAQTRYWVWAARILVTVGAFVLFLFTGAAGTLARAVARITRSSVVHDGLFAAAMLAYLFCLLLPVDLYADYVRPRQFGFADRPLFDWLSDEVLNWAVMSVLYLIGITAIMALMRRGARAWVGWAGAIYLALAGAYTIAAPTVIEPLFNSYTPMAEGSLKHAILAMARANNVPADNVFTLNASRQTRLLNAHVSGFAGTARISLDDNLLAGVYEPSVLMVVGHEIGHYVMGHVIYGLLVMTGIAVLGFLFIAWMAPVLVQRFGDAWTIPSMATPGGVAVFWFLFLVYGFASDPLENAYQRTQEAQADLYGLNASQAPNGMAEFMIHDADTARLDPTPLDILLFYDHPGDRSRVETAMRWRAAHLPPQTPRRAAPIT